jgi:hypothetical protein
MPLSKETRYLLEVALTGYLKTHEEATSSEIYEHFKQRGFLVINVFQKYKDLLSREN